MERLARFQAIKIQGPDKPLKTIDFISHKLIFDNIANKPLYSFKLRHKVFTMLGKRSALSGFVKIWKVCAVRIWRNSNLVFYFLNTQIIV